MAKTKISEFSSTPGNNTDIDSINIAEGCAPSGINDAIRELMAQLKDFQTGAAGDSFNGPIGTTTAAAGAFTNLTASGTLGVTGVATFTAKPVLSSLTASQAVFSDGSKGLVSNAITGTGNVVMSTSPTLVTPVLGTPTSVTLTNATGLPISTGVSGLGTGIATALAVNVGSAGAPVLFNGALGTPSSGTVTNLTGTASININGTVGATTANTGAFTTLTTSSTVTLNGGTANGVAYLNGSKVLTTGSALTFDGTKFTVGAGAQAGYRLQSYAASGNDGISILNGANGAGDFAGLDFIHAGIQKAVFYTNSNNLTSNVTGGQQVFQIAGTEQMRLTSTGLGIGTSSPVSRLNVSGTTGFSWVGNGTSTALATIGTQGTGGSLFVNTASINSSFASGLAVDGTYSGPSSVVNLKAVGVNSGGGYNSSLAFHTSFETTLAEAMRLDSSGNLGIGTSSPWAKLSLAMSNGQMGLANGNTSGGVKIQAWNAAGNADGYLAFEGYTKEYARFDSSGNLGLGVTPSAWSGIGKTLQINTGGAISADTANTYFSSNSYYNGSNWIYQTTNNATRYTMATNFHAWYTAPSGTAGNAISFTQAMTLSADGNLGIGSTSPGSKLVVQVAASGTNIKAVDVTNATNASLEVLLRTDISTINAGGTGNLAFATGGTERARIDSSGNLIQSAPTTPPSLSTNGQMVFNLTSNTNLRVSVRGSDGVTRTANITLA